MRYFGNLVFEGEVAIVKKVGPLPQGIGFVLPKLAIGCDRSIHQPPHGAFPAGCRSAFAALENFEFGQSGGEGPCLVLAIKSYRLRTPPVVVRLIHRKFDGFAIEEGFPMSPDA